MERNILKVLFMAVSLLASAAAPAQDSIGSDDSKDKVLVLSSYQPGYEWTSTLEKTVVTRFSVDRRWSVEVECLDLVANRDSAYMREKAMTVVEEYKAHKKRAVVLLGEEAWIMWRSFMPKEWLEVPCVAIFSGTYTISAADYDSRREITDGMKIPLEESRRGINATLITDLFFVGQTIDLGLKLRPETKNIAIVTDTWQIGYIAREQMRKAMKGKFAGYKFIDLNNLEYTTHELEDKLRTLPDNTLVVFDSWYTQCGANRALYPDNALRLIAGALTRDVVFGLFDYGIREGVLTGGVYPTNSELAAALSKVLDEIEDGKAPRDMPLTFIDKAGTYLNYRNLKHNGVDEKLYPDDAIYYERPMGFMERYRHQVLVLLCAAVLLVLMVTMLAFYQHQVRKIVKKRLDISRQNERDKAQFITGMGNVMRSPLSAVNMFIDIVADPHCTLSEEEKRQYAEVAKFNTGMLLGIFNDIIDLGHLNMGQMRLDMSDTDVEMLLTNVRETLRNGEGVDFTITSDGQPHVVKADSKQFSKAVSYTILNANYRRRQQPVTVDLGSDGGMTVIAVSFDSAVAEAEAASLFDLFGDSQSTAGNGRSNLEMPLCKGLVEAMGGSIALENRPDGTSAFRIVMPQAASAPAGA